MSTIPVVAKFCIVQATCGCATLRDQPEISTRCPETFIQVGRGGQEQIPGGGRQFVRFTRRATTTWANIERALLQPFSWKAALIFVVTGAGLAWYFEREKDRMQKKRIAEANKAVGKPKVGGSFKLMDHNGSPYSDADMKGRYSLVRTIERVEGSVSLQSSYSG